MSKLSEIIADELDRGLPQYCPHCQDGIDWRQYSEKLPEQIAIKTEDFFKTYLLKIIDKFEQTIKSIEEET